MSKYAYAVQLEETPEGGYTVTVPTLPGCFTEGDTKIEALAMAEDAIVCYLESLLKDGQPIPIHRKDLKRGTLNGILKQAGLDRTDIEILLRK